MRFSSQSLYHIPVVGWLAKDAVHGHSDAKYYFVVNMLVLFAGLIYVFGYPLLISVALFAAACALTFLVILTASDAFDPRSARSDLEKRAQANRGNRRGASARSRRL